MKITTHNAAENFSVFKKLARVLFVIPKRNIYRWYLLKKLKRLGDQHTGTTPCPLLEKEGEHDGFTPPSRGGVVAIGDRGGAVKPFWRWPLDKLGVKKELFMFWRWEKNDLRQLLKKLHTTPFKIAFSVSVFALILANIFFQQAPNTALSATFYFTQSDWSGGISATAAVHPTDATNWNKYTSTSSVFAGSDLVVTSSIALASSTGSFVDTTDANFNTGSVSSTYISGDSIKMRKPVGASCTTDAECDDDYGNSGWCNSNICTVPWLSGPCSGIRVYKSDISGTKQWQTSQTSCGSPQCSGGELVSDNTVDFSAYPARNACKSLGGRLPTYSEVVCIYANASSYNTYGGFQSDTYWASNEHSAPYAWAYLFMTTGWQDIKTKTLLYYTRCVHSN